MQLYILGRPVHPQNDSLLEVIKEIAISGCAADDRRQTELNRSIRTLDDLHTEMKKVGFCLSRPSLYLRLQARRANTAEGKRHVTTVPVKLCRSQNDKRGKNADHWFAATLRSLRHFWDHHF